MNIKLMTLLGLLVLTVGWPSVAQESEKDNAELLRSKIKASQEESVEQLPGLYNQLAKILAGQGKIDESLEALEMSSKFSYAISSRKERKAQVHWTQQQRRANLMKKIDQLEKSISETPEDKKEEKIQLLREQAKLHERLGDLSRSLNILEKARSLMWMNDFGRLNGEVEYDYWKVMNRWNQLSKRQRRSQRSVEVRPDVALLKNKVQVPVFEQESISAATRNSSREGVALGFSKPRHLKFSNMNGFGVIAEIPELASAYIHPGKALWMDFNLDLASFKEKESIKNISLSADTTILRFLFETTYRRDSFRLGGFPYDLKLGVPVIKWGELPTLSYDFGTTQLFPSGSGSFALGDIYLQSRIFIMKIYNKSFSLMNRISLPTGSTSKLSGSGGFGFSTAFLMSSQSEKLDWDINIGGVLTGDSDVLINSPDVSLSDVIYFGGRVRYALKEYLSWNASLEGHQNIFEGYTGLGALDDPSLTIGVGLSLQTDFHLMSVGFKRGLTASSVDNQFVISLGRNTNGLKIFQKNRRHTELDNEERKAYQHRRF